MTLPLLVSLGVMGASAIFPPKKGDASGSKASSSSTGIISIGSVGTFLGSLREGNHAFMTGIVIGLGFSWVLSYELQRSRLHDKLRLFLIGWLRPVSSTSSSEGGDDANYQNSVPKSGEVFSVRQNATVSVPLNGDDGNAVTTIISSDISLTSSLWVSTIHLPPKHELTIQRATGMEFFYVLEGSGEWSSTKRIMTTTTSDSAEDGVESKQGKDATIDHGDALIIEANSSRWFKNTSTSRDLILLRSSDAGYLNRKAGYDCVVSSSSNNNRSVVTAVTGQISTALSTGMEQVGGYLTSLLGSKAVV